MYEGTSYHNDYSLMRERPPPRIYSAHRLHGTGTGALPLQSHALALEHGEKRLAALQNLQVSSLRLLDGFVVVVPRGELSSDGLVQGGEALRKHLEIALNLSLFCLLLVNLFVDCRALVAEFVDACERRGRRNVRNSASGRRTLVRTPRSRGGGGGDTVDDSTRATVGSIFRFAPAWAKKVRGRDGRRSTTTRKDARWERRRRRIPGIALRLSVASRTSDQLTVLVGESTTFGSIHVCSPATLLTSASASALGYVRVRAVPLRRSLFPKRLLASSPVSARVSAKCM